MINSALYDNWYLQTINETMKQGLVGESRRSIPNPLSCAGHSEKVIFEKRVVMVRFGNWFKCLAPEMQR
jgi:hypothetical protein